LEFVSTLSELEAGFTEEWRLDPSSSDPSSSSPTIRRPKRIFQMKQADVAFKHITNADASPHSKVATTGRSVVMHFRQGARWGFVAKGIVYLSVGFISASAALGLRRSPVDTRGAVRQLFGQTHSDIFLWTLCIALSLYAGWRFFQAATAQAAGARSMPWWKRAHLLISGCIHAGFAFWILRFLTWGGGPSSEARTHATSAVVFQHPQGRLVAFAVGVGICVTGLYQFYRCATGRVKRDLERVNSSTLGTKVLLALGRIGEATRGLLLSTIGATVLSAALRTDPNEVRGFAGTLGHFRAWPLGPWILLACGGGFISLGLFLIFSARYQKL
jgi:hypothetical protein